MRRLTPALVAIAALALPTSAMAASSRGVVLSVDRSHHTIQVVDSKHQVHAYRFRGQLPSLHTGSAIAFRASGATISHVKVTSKRSRTVSYYARVVHSSASGVVLRLADGKTVTFPSHEVKH